MEANQAYWQGRRVCVTGGSGFLGYHLIRQLLHFGAKVVSLSLPPKDDHPLLQCSEITHLFGDIREKSIVAHALQGCDSLIHTAGMVSMWGPSQTKMLSVHQQGTQNVLELAPPSCRIVHTSSIVAIGATTNKKILMESSPFDLPVQQLPYVQAKRNAEILALQSDRDVVVVNPGYLIGPEDYEQSVMGRFCLRYWRGRVPIAPPGGINLVDVRDVALGHLLAAEHGTSGQRYILAHENHTYRSFMEQLAQVAEYHPRGTPKLPWPALRLFASLAEIRSHWTKREPYPSLGHARMNRYFWYVDSTKAKQTLGYQPRPIQQTIQDTFAWYRHHYKIQLRGTNRWWLRPAA